MKFLKLKDKQLTIQTSNNYLKIIDEKRGNLFAFNKFQNFYFKRFYLIEPEQNIWRGKHFHKECTQLITVINGEITCKLINNQSEIISNFLLKEGQIFLQQPNFALCFKSNLKNTKILVFSNKEFDSNDYYEVVTNE